MQTLSEFLVVEQVWVVTAGWERILVLLASELGEAEEAAAAAQCIEEVHSVRVVVVSSNLTVVVVVAVEEVCIPVSAELSSLVEECVEAVRNVYGPSLRNAKYCEGRCGFCCVDFLPLYLQLPELHRHQRVVGCEDLDACLHLESFQRPMLQHRHLRQEEARQHFH
jgi:hypothetical protein